MKKRVYKDYFRSIIFGIEDALVSTTGVVVGISAGTHEKQVVILAGLVTVAVEALSMGAGQYLSEEAVHQMDGKRKHKDSAFVSAVLMFFAYGIAGFVPIFPTFVFSRTYAPIMSVFAALLGLFLLGYAKGKFLNISRQKSALEMMVIGGVATMLGLFVGNLFKI